MASTVATAGRGGQFVGRVVDVQPIAVGDVFGATVGAVDHVAGLGRLFVERGDANAQGGLHGAPGDLE